MRSWPSRSLTNRPRGIDARSSAISMRIPGSCFNRSMRRCGVRSRTAIGAARRCPPQRGLQRADPSPRRGHHRERPGDDAAAENDGRRGELPGGVARWPLAGRRIGRVWPRRGVRGTVPGARSPPAGVDRGWRESRLGREPTRTVLPESGRCPGKAPHDGRLEPGSPTHVLARQSLFDFDPRELGFLCGPVRCYDVSELTLVVHHLHRAAAELIRAAQQK